MPAEVMQIEIAVDPYAPAVYPPRKRWTRAECTSLESTGLWERDHLELIEGELITKMPKKRPHTIAYLYLLEWLGAVFGIRYLNPETAIDVAPEDNPTSEPEPDIAVLSGLASAYVKSNPPASDVRLVVEVSDSTLAFDQGPKARLYARADIQEYWVVDVKSSQIIVHRIPTNGIYATIAAYERGETIAPLAAPDSPLAVSTIFPGE